MSVDKLIRDTLTPLDVPVTKARYNLPSDRYIVYIEYNQAPQINADDKELITKYFYQVDVFSKTNFSELVKNVRKRMIETGFTRMFESETFDEDMNMYRKIFRFNYQKYNK